MNTSSSFMPLFQLFGRETPNSVDRVNHAAYEQLLNILQRPLSAHGICTLLRAPRAGYGKSHLLCRLQQQLRGTHEFVLLHAAEGHRFDASASLENVITQLTQPLPGAAGLTELDMLSRKLFALGLEPLVRSGEIPSQDRDSALLSLSQRPTETFDFHHPSAVTAHWARDNFEILGPRLIVELSQLLLCPMRDIAFWVEMFFRYAIIVPEHPGRLAALLSAVGSSSPSAAHDRLSSLLLLLSQWQRIVLIVDELEGLSVNPEAALRLATFLTTLRHGAERVDVVLSVNDDIWESAFVPRLSGGLLDRLTEAFVRLTPLTEDEALALLRSRHPSVTMANLEHLQIKGDLYARAVLRAAAEQTPLPVFVPAATPIQSPEPAAVQTFTSSDWLTQEEQNQINALSEAAFADPVPILAPPVSPAPKPVPEETSWTSPFSTTPLSEIANDFKQLQDSPDDMFAPAPPESHANESDRINELLNQFRERYGNPNS